MKRHWIAAALTLAVSMLAGCHSMEYQGVSPSVRRYADHPQFKDMYVGADLKFAVDRPIEYRPLHHAMAAQPIDEQAISAPSLDHAGMRSATIAPTAAE